MVSFTKRPDLCWLFEFGVLSLASQAQGPRPGAPETRHYVVEVAGLRVGTMTATRAPQAGPDVVYTLTSDVKVNFLFYHPKIYYHVVNRVRNGQLLLSIVETHTNQGDFASRAEWKEDHYDIIADQYQHHYRATEKRVICCTVTQLFFAEPTGQPNAYAEYFSD